MLRLPTPAALHTRHRQPELMDDPGLVEAEHVRALRGLARINAWSGSGQITIRVPINYDSGGKWIWRRTSFRRWAHEW